MRNARGNLEVSVEIRPELKEERTVHLKCYPTEAEQSFGWHENRIHGNPEDKVQRFGMEIGERPEETPGNMRKLL